MYAHVSREEWIWRGLAIATILALVGMAVMPLAVRGIGVYLLTQGDWVGGGSAVGGGLATLEGAVYSYATAETITTLAAVGLGLAGIGGLIVLG